MYKNKPRNTPIQSVFCWRSNPNNDKHNFLETRSENGCENREKRPGDQAGVKNDIFWTEIGSIFGEPDGTVLPRILIFAILMLLQSTMTRVYLF